MKTLWLLAAAAVIVLFYHLNPVARPHPYIIVHDTGGMITSYVSHYNALRESGVPVQIAGECDSACTAVFVLPHNQVCAWPRRAAWLSWRDH